MEQVREGKKGRDIEALVVNNPNLQMESECPGLAQSE